MIGEPPRTQYDWHFRILGFPVRVHPYFWALTAMLGLNNNPRGLFIWIGVVFVSILVHELGHTIAIRYCGDAARIVLYSFGGLAITEPGHGRSVRRTPTQQVLISLAGPVAGFLFAALVIALLFATGYYVYISLPMFGDFIQLGTGERLVKFDAKGVPLITPIFSLVRSLLHVNIFWGLFNLMPIYPLDGGQVARQLFLVNSNDGIRSSLQLSIGTAAVLAGLAAINRQPYLAVMLGYMAYTNYQQLSSGGFGGFGNRSW